MGNLSNLYVSKSFQSLIHLGTDNVATPSLTTLQDGYGNSIGIEVNTAGDLFLSGSLTASLQQGYVWVGNASGKTTTVSTSSFGGGGTINTGSLVTTASFNSYTSSNNQRVSSLESATASLNTSVTNLNSATSSLFTSASLALTTASVSGTTMTFTKGNGTTFNVTLPTGSGGGTIDTASFATTGSNTFRGDQIVLGDIRISGSTDNHLFINRPGGGDILRLGVSNNGNTFDFHITGSADQQLWLIDNQGGTWLNTFFGGIQAEGKTTINAPFTASQGAQINGGDLRVANNLTASLQQGYVWVGNSSGRTTTVPTSSFAGLAPVGVATTGSNSFNGDQNVTGSVTISGSATNDLVIQGRALISGPASGQTPQLEVSSSLGRSVLSRGGLFAVDSTGTNLELSTATDGAAYLALWNATGAEIGFNLSPSSSGYVTGWSGGPSIYINDGPGNFPAAIGFQSAANYTDGTVTILKPLDVRGNTTITGSLTISSSAAVELQVIGDSVFTGSLLISGSSATDLLVQGRQIITGPTTGQTPQLFISSSTYNNLIETNRFRIQKPSFSYELFNAGITSLSSSFLYNFSDNLSATASYTVGVFDESFTQDVELALETTTTNGILFKDIRSDTFAYTTWLKIAPNGGSNPPLEFKRGMQVTGSVSIAPTHQVRFATGSNQQAGTAVLDGGNPGTVTVSNSLVTANSIIMVSKQTLAHTNGYVAVSSKGAGTFTITSNHNGDTDTVGYFIINNS